MILGLVSWLFGRSEPPGRVGEPSDAGADVDVDELAARARSDRLTPDVLSNEHDRSAYPLTAYLEDGEQPAYVFRGGDLLISNAEDSLARKHPSRELQVVISDRRLLFVMGGRRSDELWEIPLEDVEEVYLDDESNRQYIIVESERDDALMTFFADVTLNMNPEHVREAIAFVEASSDSDPLKGETESADRRADE